MAVSDTNTSRHACLLCSSSGQSLTASHDRIHTPKALSHSLVDIVPACITSLTYRPRSCAPHQWLNIFQGGGLCLVVTEYACPLVRSMDLGSIFFTLDHFLCYGRTKETRRHRCHWLRAGGCSSGVHINSVLVPITLKADDRFIGAWLTTIRYRQLRWQHPGSYVSLELNMNNNYQYML